jgi:simple sugar transport system permease protein
MTAATSPAVTPPSATPPAAAQHRTLWQAILDTLAVPVLAILTAFIVGSVVIVLSDLEVLAALRNFFAAPVAALAAMWRAISTAYGALLEGALGNPAQIVSALASGDQAAIAAAFYPLLDSLITAKP